MGLSEDLERARDLDPVDVLGCFNLTMANKSSASRLHLTSTYFEQSLIINESEVPKMYTGFEKQLGFFNDSLKISKVPYRILHRIEKFPTHPGVHYLIVVQDVNSGVVDIIENKHYENLAEEHGYFKPRVDVDGYAPGTTIKQGEILSKSNSHDEYLNYKFGVNANVAYISKKDNIEDGIIISESFSKRVSYTSIKIIDVLLGFNDILLNVYGSENNYKSFPEIFQDIEKGIFCVKRSIDHLSAACNTSTNSLMNIDTNDEIFYGDGKLIDIEIYINSNQELFRDNGHRQQILRYYEVVKNYKNSVMKALEPYIRSHTVKCTTNAVSKYYNYKNYIDTCNSPNNEVRFASASGTTGFEFAYIKFITGKNNYISEGSKLTNRCGGKGVACRVMPDDLMPIDAYGNRAEVIINPCGVIGRTNPAQLYEHELNFISDRVLHMIIKSDNLSDKYSILKKFLCMVEEETFIEFEKRYKRLNTFQRKKYFENIEKEGIYIRQHPFKNITFERLKELYMEFNIKPSKITVGVKLPDGSVKKYKSKNPVIIGKAYIMLLKHTTESKFSSVSISDVNNLGLPHKSNSSKSKNLPYRSTPIKFGEMELNIAINRVDPLVVNRFMAGSGSNLKHRDRISRMLLEEDPFMYHDIDVKDDEIVDNIASDAFVAIMRQLGYCIYSDVFRKTITVGKYPENNTK